MVDAKIRAQVEALRQYIENQQQQRVAHLIHLGQQERIKIVISAFREANPDMDEPAMTEAMKLYPPEPGEVLLNYLDRLHSLTMKETP
jgi:hypothetical protein